MENAIHKESEKACIFSKQGVLELLTLRYKFFTGNKPPFDTYFNHCVDGVQLNMLLFLHREFGKQHGFPIFSFYQLLPTHPNPVSQRQNYYFWHSYRNYVEFVILK